MPFFAASLGCDNGILWIITAVQSLINVCKTLGSSDEVRYVHPVQHIIANEHRQFLIPATTHSWCFSYHKNNHMRMAMMGRAKVQLSHYVVSRKSRCLRKRTAKKTDALSGKPSWLLATNILMTLWSGGYIQNLPLKGILVHAFSTSAWWAGGLTLRTLHRVFSSAWDREPRGRK